LANGLDNIAIRAADKKRDHKALLAIAKTSPYTRDFSNEVMFSSENAYSKGWIRMLCLNEEPIGFYCVRHKSQGDRETALYFITVLPGYRSLDAGRHLMDDLKAQSPTGIIRLNVAKDNRAVSFYERHGFTKIGESLGGKGWRMEWRR
jgi:ribosomal protein S18 acetylase RimI-like enzyme